MAPFWDTMSLIYGYKEIVIFKKIDIFSFVNDSEQHI
jgi:hypothetical protein